MEKHMELHQKMDPAVQEFDRQLLGPNFPAELELVSRLWFKCGYRPGISAYLNFFLLTDFIVTHDNAYPPRFQSFRSMADSFYQTDLFIRDVTDSGPNATGGISSAKVRKLLASIMQRHRNVSIPAWMMTYFGFSLVETVEKQCAPLTEEELQLHLSYMSKTYRIMGMSFSSDRRLMDEFARAVEKKFAGTTPFLEKHSRNILVLGEMIGVSSGPESILSMLPEATRAVFEPVYPKVKPNVFRRLGARAMGKLLMKQAIGAPRKAVPVAE